MEDYGWIITLADEARLESHRLGAIFASAITKLNFYPVDAHERRRAVLLLARDAIQLNKHGTEDNHSFSDEAMDAVKTLGADWLNNQPLDAEKLTPLLSAIFFNVFEGITKNPEFIDFIEDYDLLSDMAATLGERYVPFFRFFPIFTSEAHHLAPYLKEPLFDSLFELPDEDQEKLAQLSEKILSKYYSFSVRPKLVQLLSQSSRSLKLLLPLIDEVLREIPPEKCITIIIHLICTPRGELNQGRVISIILQELGGLYVKLGQVLSEIAPIALSRELKYQQDKLGGIFGSQEKSWEYVLRIFDRPAWKRMREFICIPEHSCSSFAGASVGAIYEFELSDLGKEKLKTEKSVLIKIQRPELHELFRGQKETLLSIINKIESQLANESLPIDEISDLRGLSTALRRSIENYADQSLNELDFRREKKNAELVREALKGHYKLRVPRYFHVEADVIMMEKVTGEKVTSVVNSRYLERMIIADTICDAYLYLMFKKGIIWADPHAGNILLDPEKHEVHLVDLTPCYKWERRTTHIFVGFLYRIIVSDHKGILSSLSELVETPDVLKHSETKERIKEFIQRGNKGTFVRYLSDFVKILGESNINLKIEVQAALRGITQIYLTASSISSRHHFGPIFQKQFGWQMLLAQILTIGPFKVTRASLPIAFDLVRNSPEEETGPTIDERDISELEKALELLRDEHVCNIELKRTGPEENQRLLLSSDGSRLIRSAHLRLEMLTESKPASVLYVLEIPSKEWLKERQEYIKLQGLGFVLCMVESLEQLRRHSLENYWYVVESWNCPLKSRSHTENKLISEVRISARVLFQKRFNNVWDTDLMKVSCHNKYLWKTQNLLETRLEKIERNHYRFLEKKIGQEKVGHYTLGSIHRLKIIIHRLMIQGLKTLLRRSKFEMNLLPLATSDLIDRMIHGLLRHR
jgi:predicted unusual protein kinase regulating ubiquinone biosynthesis (AarF/ABC1/UbiB family)